MVITSEAPPRWLSTTAAIRTVAGAYVALSALWIAGSDALVNALFETPLDIERAQTVKGWLFVAVTGALLYGVLRWLVESREAALHRQAEAAGLLRALAEHSTDAIFAKDRQGRYLLFNREAGRVTGVAAEAALGRDDGALFPAQAAAIRANDEAVMAADRAMTFEEEVDTAVGRITYLATKGPLHGSDGSVIGLFGISRDIGEMVLARRALQASERRWRLVFEAHPQPAWVYELDTLRILAVNDAAVAAYGYPRERFVGMTLLDLRPPEQHDAMRREVARRPGAEEGRPHVTGPWVHRRADGEVIEVEISSSDIEFEGRPARLVQAQDVTERRVAEEALLRTQAELSELTQRLLAQERETNTRIAHALHDRVGQLLGSARLHLDVALRRAGAAEAPWRASLDRLSQVLDAAVAEVRSALVELRPPLLQERGLAAALDNELRQGSHLGLGVDCRLEVAPQARDRRWPPAVEYAAFMVAREAIANALRHAGAACVTLALDGDEGRLRLSVADDGHGIADADRLGRPGHLGLVGMRERALKIGARLLVEAPAGGGTRVLLQWEPDAP